MEQTIVQLISRATGATFAATSRPAMTFFFCQCAIALALKFHWIVMDPRVQFLVSTPMLVGGFVATVLELLVEHTEDVEEVVRNLHIDKLWRVMGAFGVGVLMVSIGAEQRAEMLAPATAEAVQTVTSAARSGQPIISAADWGQPFWVKSTTIVAAVGANQGLTWLRGYLLDWLANVNLKRIWQYIETGGVIGFLIVLAVSPLLTLVLAVVATVVMLALALAIRVLEKAWDRSHRRLCPSCGKLQVRHEALCCPSCKAELEPVRWLGHTSMWGERKEAEPAPVSPIPT